MKIKITASYIVAAHSLSYFSFYYLEFAERWQLQWENGYEQWVFQSFFSSYITKIVSLLLNHCDISLWIDSFHNMFKIIIFLINSWIMLLIFIFCLSICYFKQNSHFALDDILIYTTSVVRLQICELFCIEFFSFSSRIELPGLVQNVRKIFCGSKNKQFEFIIFIIKRKRRYISFKNLKKMKENKSFQQF